MNTCASVCPHSWCLLCCVCVPSVLPSVEVEVIKKRKRKHLGNDLKHGQLAKLQIDWLSFTLCPSFCLYFSVSLSLSVSVSLSHSLSLSCDL